MALNAGRVRAGRREDADVLAQLVNFAGEGLPLHLWGRLADGDTTAWDVGIARARRETGSFSYRNATIIEAEGRAAGALIGYAIPDAPEPIPADMPALVVPLQELENLAPGTWYVNVLAVLPEFRGRGLGTALLGVAEETAREAGLGGLSVIVSDANDGARRLYEGCGYREAGRRQKVKEDWAGPGREWVLLRKPIPSR